MTYDPYEDDIEEFNKNEADDYRHELDEEEDWDPNDRSPLFEEQGHPDDPEPFYSEEEWDDY